MNNINITFQLLKEINKNNQYNFSESELVEFSLIIEKCKNNYNINLCSIIKGLFLFSSKNNTKLLFDLNTNKRIDRFVENDIDKQSNLIANILSELSNNFTTLLISDINICNNMLTIKYKQINNMTDKIEEKTESTVNFQECANLEVEDMYSQSKGDTLGEIMNLQKDIQETVYKYNFKELQEGKLKDLKSFIDWNEEAIRDEQREFANALGGIHTMSNNLWKPWKSKHLEANNRSLKDLTPEELLELKYEWIDQLHFFINIGLSIGLNEKEVYNLYFAKNKHNRDRQNKPGGY